MLTSRFIRHIEPFPNYRLYLIPYEAYREPIHSNMLPFRKRLHDPLIILASAISAMSAIITRFRFQFYSAFSDIVSGVTEIIKFRKHRQLSTEAIFDHLWRMLGMDGIFTASAQGKEQSVRSNGLLENHAYVEWSLEFCRHCLAALRPCNSKENQERKDSNIWWTL
ncbi:hypothetical protein ACOME3_009531 [Neoechinorhynchus agilis]